MFLKNQIITSTGNYLEEVNRLKEEIKTADAILIGAGAGMSTSAGLTYSGERFLKYFSDFKNKYGIEDMYSGGFYPYSSQEEFWAWWSRHIWYNRYEPDAGKPYTDLLKLIYGKDSFVLTTNVDHQFQKAGFDKNRLFYTQGDYGLWQCANGCDNKTYDNESQVKLMIEQQSNMRIPSELIPHCPICGEPMTMNLRCDNKFVEDAGWHDAAKRYEEFTQTHLHDHVLYLELGVGSNTPVIIKYPFWQMTANNEKAIYACINHEKAYCPSEIKNRSICIDADIGRAIREILNKC